MVCPSTTFLTANDWKQRRSEILRQLPELYSLALLWRYWENRSVREMADATGKTEKAIERLLARARARFRDTVGAGIAMDDERWLERVAAATDFDADRAGARAGAAQGAHLFRAREPPGADRSPPHAWVRRRQPAADCACSKQPSPCCPSADRIGSMNPCRVCHARVLAERLDDAPIFWPGLSVRGVPSPFARLTDSPARTTVIRSA